jgi:hypothetical protein
MCGGVVMWQSCCTSTCWDTRLTSDRYDHMIAIFSYLLLMSSHHHNIHSWSA